MAFGLGFVLGPLLGLLLQLAARADWNLRVPVPGGRWLLDAGVGARSDPSSRVEASGQWREAARTMTAEDRRHAHAPRRRPAHPGRIPVRVCVCRVRDRALYLRTGSTGKRGRCTFAGIGLLSAVVQGVDPASRPTLARLRLVVAGFVLAALGFLGLANAWSPASSLVPCCCLASN